VDTIDQAREAMERADDAFAAYAGHCDATLDALAQAVDDAERAYYRACDLWEPAR
jgi:hypothetical protein